jgi:hypothetical protein
VTTLAPDDHRHGTTNGYSNWKCKCPLCRRAWADYVAVRARERRREAMGNYNSSVHGQLRTYNKGCLCGRCQEAFEQRQQDIKAVRTRVSDRHECHQVAPVGMSKSDREGFICNDCLDKFQAWLRSLL